MRISICTLVAVTALGASGATTSVRGQAQPSDSQAVSMIDAIALYVGRTGPNDVVDSCSLLKALDRTTLTSLVRERAAHVLDERESPCDVTRHRENDPLSIESIQLAGDTARVRITRWRGHYRWEEDLILAWLGPDVNRWAFVSVDWRQTAHASRIPFGAPAASAENVVRAIRDRPGFGEALLDHRRSNYTGTFSLAPAGLAGPVAEARCEESIWRWLHESDPENTPLPPPCPLMVRVAEALEMEEGDYAGAVACEVERRGAAGSAFAIPSSYPDCETPSSRPVLLLSRERAGRSDRWHYQVRAAGRGVLALFEVTVRGAGTVEEVEETFIVRDGRAH